MRAAMRQAQIPFISCSTSACFLYLSPSFASSSSSFFAASFCPALISALARFNRIAGDVGASCDCLLQQFDAARLVALFDEKRAQRVEDARLIGSELVRLLRVLDRSWILDLSRCPGEIVQKHRIVRLEFEQFPVVPGCGREVALGERAFGEIKSERRVFRMFLDPIRCHLIGFGRVARARSSAWCSFMARSTVPACLSPVR